MYKFTFSWFPLPTILPLTVFLAVVKYTCSCVTSGLSTFRNRQFLHLPISIRVSHLVKHVDPIAECDALVVWGEFDDDLGASLFLGVVQRTKSAKDGRSSWCSGLWRGRSTRRSKSIHWSRTMSRSWIRAGTIGTLRCWSNLPAYDPDGVFHGLHACLFLGHLDVSTPISEVRAVQYCYQIKEQHGITCQD